MALTSLLVCFDMQDSSFSVAQHQTNERAGLSAPLTVSAYPLSDDVINQLGLTHLCSRHRASAPRR